MVTTMQMNKQNRRLIWLCLVGAAVITIILTVLGAYRQFGHGGFASVDNNRSALKTTLNAKLKGNHEIMVVFHQTGCSDCNKVKDTLVDQVKQARQKKKTVLVYDTKNMSKSEINWLKEQFPRIVQDDGHIHTPTIMTIYPDAQRQKWVVDQYIVEQGNQTTKKFFDQEVNK